MIELNAQTASEFDFIVGLDASGSMATESKRFPGKTRWQEAQESIFGIAMALEKFDADGIDVVIFGGTTEMVEGVTAAKVADIFASRSPRGSTPLHDAVDHVVKKQSRTKKNTVAIIFTDGAPDDRALVAKKITEASNAIERDENLTFLFVQIGDDSAAGQYLASLDDDLKGKFDIVDSMTAADADKLEPVDLIIKAIND
jgi:Mg-chelatase subunit ChlD